MISDKYWDDPLFDPEDIDPYGDSITALVEHVDSGNFRVGVVCETYELCGHLLCKASYEMYVAHDLTKAALAARMKE